MVTRNSASAIPAAHRTPLAMSAGIRYVGVLSGRYVVVPTDGAEGGPTVAFACRTTSLSPNLDHAGRAGGRASWAKRNHPARAHRSFEGRGRATRFGWISRRYLGHAPRSRQAGGQDQLAQEPQTPKDRTLGSVAAIVVRHIETGFGVAFRDGSSLESELEIRLRARRANL